MTDEETIWAAFESIMNSDICNDEPIIVDVKPPPGMKNTKKNKEKFKKVRFDIYEKLKNGAQNDG